ncbi:MAG: hypothetical protein IPJ20_23520 [Flammeovirgaceae bacterium]|nr:hypothetical protein [Flammeovirgaceae bacterium]
MSAFIFDQNRNIQLLTQQNVKIIPTIDTSNGIISFLITNDQGIKYSFSSAYLTTREATKYKPLSNPVVTHFKKDYDYYSTKVTFCKNWNLTEIRGVNNETISFGYEADGYRYSTQSYVTKVNAAMTGIDTLLYY